MRVSVAVAWPLACQRWEGSTPWMYRDTDGLVTTGTGNLIDPVEAALALPWWTGDRGLATPDDIRAEWARVKAATWPAAGRAAVWRDSAVLRLTNGEVAELLKTKTDEFWTTLGTTAPDLEAWPADAQLALLDVAWQNGPSFLKKWNDIRSAVLLQNWSTVAHIVATETSTGPRTDWRVRLLTNAAAVVRLGLDRGQLWDTTTPTKTVPPVPAPQPPKTPVPSSPKENPMLKYAPRHGVGLAHYAKSRVGDSYGVAWCQKFTNECGQTGSVGDWDGDRAADAEDGWKKAVANGKVVRASQIDDLDDIPPGVYHYWLGGSTDHGHAAVGVGGRRIVNTDMTDDGPRYGRIGTCDITQPRQHWGLTYVGYALIEGNGFTLTDAPKVKPDTKKPSGPAKPPTKPSFGDDPQIHKGTAHVLRDDTKLHVDPSSRSRVGHTRNAGDELVVLNGVGWAQRHYWVRVRVPGTTWGDLFAAHEQLGVGRAPRKD